MYINVNIPQNTETIPREMLPLCNLFFFCQFSR